MDESKEAFTWSKPNLILLADYAKQKFGWTKFKFDEIINPVMKKLAETKCQKRIESYFKVRSTSKSIESTLSRRVQTAVQKLGGKGQDADFSDSEVPPATANVKAKKVKNVSGKKRKPTGVLRKELTTISDSNEDETEEKITEEADAKLIDTSIIRKSQKSSVLDEEFIPQREQDKANALKIKLRAIEIFRKSSKGLARVKKTKKIVKKVKDNADLSESSSSS